MLMALPPCDSALLRYPLDISTPQRRLPFDLASN
jgi:hypothetical protein